MDNKEFIEKSKGILDRVKENIRQSSALKAGVVVGAMPAGVLMFLNHAIDSFYRENASTLTGVIPPISPEVLNNTVEIAMQGGGVAAGVFAAVLLAKGVVSIADRLDELERIKFERGESAANPSNPKGVRGAVRLTDKEIMRRDKQHEGGGTKGELSPLDAFYKSQGYVEKKPDAAGVETKNQTAPRLG